MSEWIVVCLGVNLDFVETEEMPRFTEEREYRLDALPSEERFVRGNVLVWAGRSNERFVYVGLLEEVVVTIRRAGLWHDQPRPRVATQGDAHPLARLTGSGAPVTVHLADKSVVTVGTLTGQPLHVDLDHALPENAALSNYVPVFVGSTEIAKVNVSSIMKARGEKAWAKLPKDACSAPTTPSI